MPFSRISSRCGLAGDTVCTIGRSVRLAVHLAFVSGPPLAKRWLALSAVAAALAFGGHTAMAADDAPAAGSSFQTEDISIGEPISLPSAPPLAAPAPAATPSGTPFQPPAAQLPSVVVPGNLGPAPGTPAPGTPAAGTPAPGTQPLTAPRSSSQPEAAGSGWLGIAVDDKLVTGRLVVVEVAQDGPAAKAGIRPQDMLLAMNGNQLQTSDELAASLAAIVPGQQVKMVVGRDNRIEDVVAQASARPPEAVSRDWQSSGFQNAPPQSAGAIPARDRRPHAIGTSRTVACQRTPCAGGPGSARHPPYNSPASPGGRGSGSDSAARFRKFGTDGPNGTGSENGTGRPKRAVSVSPLRHPRRVRHRRGAGPAGSEGRRAAGKRDRCHQQPACPIAPGSDATGVARSRGYARAHPICAPWRPIEACRCGAAIVGTAA